MALVVTCAACGKRLNIPAQLFESKIRGNIVTISCKQCGADIKVDGTNLPEDVVPDSLDSWAPPPAEATIKRVPAEGEVLKSPAATDTESRGAPQPEAQPGAPARNEPSSPRVAPVEALPAPPQGALSPVAGGRKELKSAPAFDRPTPLGVVTRKELKSAPRLDRPTPVGAAPAAAFRKELKSAPQLDKPPSAIRPGLPKPGGQVAGPKGAAGRPLPGAHPLPPVGQPSPAPKTGGVTEILWAVSFADDDDRELTLPEILRALRSGQITPQTIVWREGMDGWKPISQVPEFGPYVDSLELDEPTRLKRPEDLEALKLEPAADKSRPLPAHAPEPRAAHLVDAIESLPPDALTAFSEPPQTIDPNSPELVDSIPPAGVVPNFGPGAVGPASPDPAPGIPQRVGATPAPAAAVPVARPEPSLPPSLPPELRRRKSLAFYRTLVLGILGAAVIVLVVALARSPKEPEVTIPTLPVASTAMAAKVDSGTEPSSEPSSTPAPVNGEAEGLDLVAAIEKSLGKGASRPGAPFNRRLAQALLSTAASRAAACRVPTEQKGPAEIEVTFEPTGRVSRVDVKPPYARTGTGRCLTLTFSALRTRPFTGANVTMTQRVMVR